MIWLKHEHCVYGLPAEGQAVSGEWGETDLQNTSASLYLSQTCTLGLFPTLLNHWNVCCAVTVACQSRPDVSCLSLSSLPHYWDNRGTTSAPLHPSGAQGARCGDEIIKKKGRKKENNGVGHMLGSFEDCAAAEARGSGGWVISGRRKLSSPLPHLTWKERRTEPDHLDNSVGAEPAERIGPPAMLSWKQSKTTCSADLPELTHQQPSDDFISMSTCSN